MVCDLFLWCVLSCEVRVTEGERAGGLRGGFRFDGKYEFKVYE